MSTASSPRVLQGFRLRHDAPVFLTEEEVRWRTLRLVIGALLALLTVTLVFLVSVAFPARVSGDGVYWTTRAPLAAGVPERNDYVLASEDAGGIRSGTRIVESLFREHSVMKVIAVPGDELATTGDTLYVNGSPTAYRLQVPAGSRLSAKYLVLCKSGACTPNTLFTIPTTNVLGKVAWDEAAERERILQTSPQG